MRIRVRGPEGQSILTLLDTATVGELLSQLSKQTPNDKPEIKYGYPPKPLPLHTFEPSTKLSDTGLQIDGEQLIVSRGHYDKIETVSEPSNPSLKSSTHDLASRPLSSDPKSLSFAGKGTAPSTRTGNQTNKPLSLSRKTPSTDPPELAFALHASTMILRIMPDDNSCLFRAFGTAVLPNMDNMTELRSIVAQNIQQYPEKYSAVVLDQEPDEYCRWIQSQDAWGGAIELDILSRHFELEICSIDVQTCRVDRFNEGRETRCILVYSGIHYDTIALSPSEPPFEHAYAPPDFDTKIFEASDDTVLEKALELSKILQDRHYFTDTSKFSIRCNVCKKTFTGERGATEHAKKTGHYDFGEIG